MAELKAYETTVHGHPTTLLLSDEDAKERGLAGKAVTPEANKARTSASNK